MDVRHGKKAQPKNRQTRSRRARCAGGRAQCAREPVGGGRRQRACVVEAHRARTRERQAAGRLTEKLKANASTMNRKQPQTSKRQPRPEAPSTGRGAASALDALIKRRI